MRTINKILLFLLLTGIWSCDSWLDVKPSDQVSENKVFESEKGFYSALNGIYIELIKPELYGVTLSCEMVELLAQRYNPKTDNTNYKELVEFKYKEEYVKGRLQSTWNAVYKLILDCNVILENAEIHRDVLSDRAYGVVKGEALALRAFLHFDMLRMFGPVYQQHAARQSIPYAEKVTVSASDILPADSVTTKILRDLSMAEDLLLTTDPVITDGPQMVEQSDNTYAFRCLRLNYYAVLALQARVYLYANDQENARRYALKVIGDEKVKEYFPFTGYEDIVGNKAFPDRVFSSEMLFGLYNTERDEIYKNYFDEESAASNLLLPRVGTIEALYAGEEGDYRYSIWQSSRVPGDNSLLCYRLKDVGTTGLYDDLMPLIRIGELYLIAAECGINDTESYGYLNTLRNNRGLVQVSENLETHLEHEYQKEFLCEGQLFFFYKRKNTPALISPLTGKKVTMTENAYVPPLPESETKYRN